MIMIKMLMKLTPTEDFMGYCESRNPLQEKHAEFPPAGGNDKRVEFYGNLHRGFVIPAKAGNRFFFQRS